MKPDIIIVSLSTGDPDLLNVKTINAIQQADQFVLRTGHHGIVPWLQIHQIQYSTLDHLYELSMDFDQLNQSIAEYLITLAESAQVVYGVVDAASDLTVRSLLRINENHLNIQIIPGTGLTDICLSAVIPFLNDQSIVHSSASSFISLACYDPGLSLLVTELDNDILAGQVKCVLSNYVDDEFSVYFIQENNQIKIIPLYELDRQTTISHHTALYIPGSEYLMRNHFVMNDLQSIMNKLRSHDGCPWDRVQTHKSLRQYMIEEAWECVAAIEEENMDHLCEELGDLLFQIVFHASIGESFDEFDMNDVINSICRKMIRRHPHVFMSQEHTTDRDVVIRQWEKIKRDETGKETVVSSLEDISNGLPSLKYAAKTFKKLYQINAFKRPGAVILDDIRNLAEELNSTNEHPEESKLGRMLLLCSELCYTYGTDGELLLHQTVNYMKTKLKRLEQRIKKEGKSLEDLTFEELGVYLKHVEGEIE